MLSDKQVSKFQALYLSRFGKEIGMEEAREKGAALVGFLKIVLKPMTKEEFRMIQEHQSQLPNN